MATQLHLLITAEGTYYNAGVLFNGEIWGVTLRCVPILGSTLTPVGELPDNFDVAAASISDSDTDWVASSNWLLEGGTTDIDPVSMLVDQVKPAFESWVANSMMHGQAQLDSLKVYPIGTDGRAIPAPPYALGSPAVLTYTGTHPKGTGSGVMLPLQNAVAVSHRSDQVGRRGQGRMFCPALPAAVLAATTAVTLSTTARDAFNARQKALLEDISFVSSNKSWFPAVVSNVGSPTTPNFRDYATITAVRTGLVVDTQRRRRNAQVESYAEVSVDYSP